MFRMTYGVPEIPYRNSTASPIFTFTFTFTFTFASFAVFVGQKSFSFGLRGESLQGAVVSASTSATRFFTRMMLSGLREMESMPSRTRNAAKSG